jgi:hypothetical protein
LLIYLLQRGSGTLRDLKRYRPVQTSIQLDGPGNQDRLIGFSGLSAACPANKTLLHGAAEMSDIPCSVGPNARRNISISGFFYYKKARFHPVQHAAQTPKPCL